MASTNKTANFNLTQFVGTDKPDWLTDYNGDMLAVDNALSTVTATAQAAEASAQAAQISAQAAETSAERAIESVSGAAALAQQAFDKAEKADENATSATHIAENAAATAASALVHAEKAEATADSLKDDVDSLKTWSAAAESRITTNEGNIAKLGERMGAAESRLDDHDTAISSLTSELQDETNARESADASMQATITQLGLAVANHNSSIAELVDDLTNEQKNRADADDELSNRITALESSETPGLADMTIADFDRFVLVENGVTTYESLANLVSDVIDDEEISLLGKLTPNAKIMFVTLTDDGKVAGITRVYRIHSVSSASAMFYENTYAMLKVDQVSATQFLTGPKTEKINFTWQAAQKRMNVYMTYNALVCPDYFEPTASATITKADVYAFSHTSTVDTVVAAGSTTKVALAIKF